MQNSKTKRKQKQKQKYENTTTGNDIKNNNVKLKHKK